MITYQVPLGVYPDTCNGSPLTYAALASLGDAIGVVSVGHFVGHTKSAASPRRGAGRRA